MNLLSCAKSCAAAALVAAALVLAITPAALADESTGEIRGTVKDDDSGDRLSGASVLIVGTTMGASTDLDGEYRVEGLPPGTYKVRFSFMGYVTEVVPAVRVDAGNDKRLDVRLRRERGAAASFTIDDLIVTADRVMSTEVALITERMQAITIGDAISAERISKSPDGSSSDVLKRVTGLSIKDNKFVYVRGITDRYNVTWLDDVTTSSTDTDVDRRSFTFDILPSSLLASAVVVKTATPDLPADFTGGVVRLNTRDIPAGRELKVSVSSSHDEETTGSNFLRTEGGGTDWLGIDDGSRELPDFDPSPSNNYNKLARKLPNSWSMRNETAPLNGSYSLSYGDRLDLGADDGKHVVGLVTGVKYSTSYQHVDFVESPRDTSGYELYHKEGTKDRYKVVWSGLMNLTYSPSPKHQYSLRGLYVRDARDQVSYSEGAVSVNSGPGGKSYTYEWDERTRYSLQLGGDHEFGGRRSGEPTLKWKVFGSQSTASEPDRRQADFQLRADGTHSLSENERTWSDLDERAGGARADLSVSVWETALKAGTYIEKRKRDYDTDAFYTDASTIRPPNYWIRVAGIDTIFVPVNYGPRKLTFRTKSSHTGEYEATHDTEAYYVMADRPFRFGRNTLRLAGGVRVEHSDQRVEALSREGDDEPVVSRIDETDTFPSASLTYSPLERLNVRLAYFRSINRPELREMADIKYHDFNDGVNVKGNPDLKRAQIDNYDVRIEAFPGSDEVLAVSYFYKRIEDAIEVKLIPSSDYNYVRTWFNSPKGVNQGYEIDVTKSLGFMGRPFGGGAEDFLGKLTISGNYARVYSAVDYLYEWRWQDDEGNWHTGREIRTRPLQGQSPWTLNLALLYRDPDTGTSVSVLYNKIARRLYSVSGDPTSDLWQESRDVLDAAVTQRLFGCWEVKFTAKNILRSDEVKTMGPDKLVHTRETTGTTYSLSVGLDL